MDFNPQDQEVIRLLKKLKDLDVEYPEKMLVARRRSFLKRMTEIELGIPADQAIRHKVSNPKPFNLSPTASALLETVLIAAIVVETGVMAYFYRQELADFFQTDTTTSDVEQVTPSSARPTLAQIQEVSPSPAITSPPPWETTAESPAGILATRTGTPVPNLGNDVSNTPGGNGASATSAPDGNNGNNGHHYGQTPKPERTKENSGNDDKPPKEDKDDKPPKDDDKPPDDKEDGRPPKDK